MHEQPKEEVHSLVGKIDKTAMGQKSTKNRPTKTTGKKKKKDNKSEWELKGGNILEEKFG